MCIDPLQLVSFVLFYLDRFCTNIAVPIPLQEIFSIENGLFSFLFFFSSFIAKPVSRFDTKATFRLVWVMG